MTTGIDPAINITTLKKLFDDFPTCFLQNFEEFVGLLWIKSEQVLEELWSYVISKELKRNANFQILDFDLFFIFYIIFETHQR